MAFDAGAIEATLTLNRNPFTAGLAAAKAQARSFERERFENTVRIKVDDVSFNAAKKQLRDFARESRTATAKVNVDRLAFDKLIRDLREFGRSRYTATADVDTSTALARIAALRNAMRGLGDESTRVGGRFRSMGDEGGNAFGRMDRGARLILTTLPLLLPVAATAVTGIIGLVGALTSIFVTAGAGVAAFGLVAVPVFKRISDAVAAGKAEIDKLPPGLRQAATALQGLNTAYEQLVIRTQKPVGLAMAAGFNAATAALKTLDPVINATSRALTTIGQMAEKYFGGPLWKDFVKLISENMEPTLTKLFLIIAYGTQAVMNLTAAFMPLAQWVLDKVSLGMKDFADWTGKLANDPKFQQWVDNVKIALEKMYYFIKEVVLFIGKLSDSLAPLGNVILTVLTNIFNGLNKMPPEWLAGIAAGLSAIVAALMLGAGGPVALFAGAIWGAAAALAYLYQNNEDVRRTIDGMIATLKEQFIPIWDTIKDNFENKIKPAWESLVKTYDEKLKPALDDLWKKFDEDIIPAINELCDTITGRLIPDFLGFAESVAPVFAAAITAIGDEINGLVLFFNGVLITITGVFQTFTGIFTGDWDKFWNGLKTIQEGVLTIIASAFGLNLEEMRGKLLDFEIWMDDNWANFWNVIHTRFVEFVTVTKNSWNDFWSEVNRIATEFEIAMDTAWANFWNGLGKIFSDWWTKTSKEWNDFWNGFFTFLQDRIAAITTGWNNFWADLGATFTAWWQRTRDEWNTFWTGVWNTAVDLWNRITGTIRDALNTIGTVVSQAATNIGNQWRTIANLFRDPINWVIEVVLNGIPKAWNAVMGWIGAPGLQVGLIPSLPRFAEGGRVYGAGTGTSDSIVARISKDEYIMPARRARNHMHFLEALRQGQPEAVQAAGGPNNVSPYPRYAAGGLAAGMAFANAQRGKPYVWGGVGPGGYDCSGIVSAVANTLLGRSPYSRIGTTGSSPWPGWSGGLTSQFGVGYFKGNPGHMASTLAGTNVESSGGVGVRIGNGRGARDGMFRGHMSLPQVGGVFSGGASGSGGGGILLSLWETLSGQVLSLLNGLIPGAIPGIGGPIGASMLNIPKALIAKVIEAAKKKLEAMFAPQTGPGGPGGPASATPAGAGVQRWAPLVLQALGMVGQPASLLQTTLRRMQQESGGNPRAINNWDINATRGTPSKGLMQVIDPTFARYRHPGAANDVWDPLANILASMRYAMARYGSLAAAYNRAGGYGEGGWLDAGAMAYNETGSKEAIFSQAQMQRMGSPDPESIAEIVRQVVTEVGGTGVNIGTVMLPAGATVKELSDEVDFRHRVTTKGRYSR